MHCCIQKGPYRIPTVLPPNGWTRHRDGYLIYTSQSKRYPIPRGTKLHRLAIAAIAAIARREGKGKREMEREDWDMVVEILREHREYVVHHQDGNKWNNCPTNLVWMPSAFNPSPAVRGQGGYFVKADKMELGWVELGTQLGIHPKPVAIPNLPKSATVLRASGECLCEFCRRPFFAHTRYRYPWGDGGPILACNGQFYHL